MKNISWSGNMGGYTDERIAPKEELFAQPKELKHQLSLETAVTLLNDLSAEVNSLYHIHAYKELYDCIIMLHGVKSQLNKIK